MEFERKTEQVHSQAINRLQVRTIFNPHHQAMLQALRVVLDLPHKTVVFKEDDATGN